MCRRAHPGLAVESAASFTRRRRAEAGGIRRHPDMCGLLGEARPSAANAPDGVRRVGHLGLTLNLVLAALATAALLALVGSIYQRAGRARDARRFPPLGRLIDIGGASLHVYTIGEGSLPVIFEAGIAATSLSWRLVRPEIAQFTQTPSYDRAGLGWRGARLQPRTVGATA